MATAERIQDTETKLWSELKASAWNDTLEGDSIFTSLYVTTCEQVEAQLATGVYDCLVDVGCGTGNIIGNVRTSVPRFGLDINPEFINHCKSLYSADIVFETGDACALVDWWESKRGSLRSPLVICCNNTINIMPKEIRARVFQQMIAVAGTNGRCLVTYWNGQMFSHAIMNYYKPNPTLCGEFTLKEVDFENRKLMTKTNYSTEWMLPDQVQRVVKTYDISVDFQDDFQPNTDHIGVHEMGIFVWFSRASTTNSKKYYDSDDAQIFYSSIWGAHTAHIGRYDLLTEEERGRLSTEEIVRRAEELHEEEIARLVRKLFRLRDVSVKLRVLDMGCGFGGLLRTLCRKGIVWRGTGVDLSTRMCDKAVELNKAAGIDGETLSIREESYAATSVPFESCDLVVALDSFIHVVPEAHEEVLREAYRVLRPGGWIVFSDIFQREGASSEALKPIYERFDLKSMATVEGFRKHLAAAGFGHFGFEALDACLTEHCDLVPKVLEEKKGSIDLSDAFIEKTARQLENWKSFGPGAVQWGVVKAQKLAKLPMLCRHGASTATAESDNGDAPGSPLSGVPSSSSSGGDSPSPSPAISSSSPSSAASR
uniref:Methyltransferase type 11 domain-containing protein n=1 Tax=Chromera velia CCMP2878 TaxID=1169474 RepID=A0A0G4I703_9ALVE|eukprot:Cvel_1922.t1-p1 / transcript=Cvel_1922.t1 / gene=Cvel_1922 / organism=Chromera_velia_CCMP2878 / gene_product=Sarcosine/dimethylglycine N-methyltransferase, putative / transcript_product=Sarcosine/dimethylglycine N-methyltransferase, putative / location=Cvel_scaffold72:42042-46174(-) / protein_length=596 / sequence_SO=supercontig / SO=protein_coding / is_pseudo=false